MQISLFDGKKEFKIDKPIRLIELFAGIGSQAKALKNLGVAFYHYRICEFDKYAVASYNAVHGTNFETSDITKITADDLGIVDTDKYCYIMTYSFPCQDLSNAGLGKGMAKGSGTRSGLLWEVERLLDECSQLPSILLMENVPQVIGQNNIQHFAKLIGKLEKLGYKNKWQVLNAKDYGIPQNRERCFMVSILGDYYYEFPKTIPLTLRLKDMLEKEVDEKYFLDSIPLKNELCDILIKNGLAEEGDVIRHSYTHSRLDNGVENMSTTESKDKLCPTLDTRCDCLGVCVKFNKPIIFDDYNHRVKADQSAINTLTTNCGNEAKGNGVKIIYPDLTIRKLTPKECWRLMGFEDKDIDNAIAVGMSNAQLYKQAGNSIVVNVLMAIFSQMI